MPDDDAQQPDLDALAMFEAFEPDMALAHQALRSAQLVLTAQRYLMDNARALPAPEPEKSDDKQAEAVSIIAPKRGRRRRDS